MRGRLARRLFPLLAMVVLISVGMITTTWGPSMIGRPEWALPYDLWGTLVAATRLTHLDVGGLYTQPTGLVSLPGAAVILVPVAAVIEAAGLSLRIPGPDNLHPAVWLLAGPYQIALSCVTLFAADALAERLGVTRWRRALLAAASAGALWSVSARWGHPEDAVAAGLLLYGMLALGQARTTLAGWLAGAAVAVQPLVLLALPVLLAMLPWRRVASFVARTALPAAVLLGVAALANWHATVTAVARQPNSPVINHPTAWTFLAPHMSGGNVSAGPARAVTILLACCCALLLRRRWLAVVSAAPRVTSSPDAMASWPTAVLADVLWWVALTLALRSFFEPVMVSYYPWPVLAVALIPAALGWRRLIAATVVAGALTAAAQGPSHNVWIWWAPLVAGLILLLAVARPGEARSFSISAGRLDGGPTIVKSFFLVKIIHRIGTRNLHGKNCLHESQLDIVHSSHCGQFAAGRRLIWLADEDSQAPTASQSVMQVSGKVWAERILRGNTMLPLYTTILPLYTHAERKVA
jgi:hypothetical protein